jgi:hypothetical protein
MNRKGIGRKYFYLFLAVSFIFCNTQTVSAVDFKQFSADMISRTAGQTEKGKIFVSGDKMRTEMAGTIMIMRMDKNISWIVMPSERLYMEQRINRDMVPKTSKEVEGEIERVSLGKEKINGMAAEKFKVTYMQNKNRLSMYQWLVDSGFPVKTEAVDGSWSVEYQNLSFQANPDSLFEVPAGYQKASMPFGQGSGMPSLDDIMSQVNKLKEE